MTRTRSASGRLSRRSGHAFERLVAKIFAALYPEADVRRCIAQSRMARREGCDVEGTPWWVECKTGRAIDWRAALEQAEADTDGRPCIVVGRVKGERVIYVYCHARELGAGCTTAVWLTLGDFARDVVGVAAAPVEEAT